MVWTSDSGSSQPDERERIAALEATVADLQRRLTALEEAGAGAGATAPYGAQQPADAVDPWSVAPWPQIVQLIQAGQKIEAIKVYRQYFSVGLKEAKDAVEEVERRIGG
jgi:ribosomal protein L7/L12